MHILITNIKDYDLFCEEYDSKGITWHNNISMLDKSIPVYKYIIKVLSSHSAVFVSMDDINTLSWCEKGDFIFSNIIKEGNYIEYNSTNVNVKTIVI